MSTLVTTKTDALLEEFRRLDALGSQAEQTARNAGKAELEIRREQGRILIEFKDEVRNQREKWGDRFAQEFPHITIRTATNWMRLHRKWPDLEKLVGSEIISDLTMVEALTYLKKPSLAIAPGEEPEDFDMTYEEVESLMAPWGDLVKTGDRKYPYELMRLFDSKYFGSLSAAYEFYTTRCADWNTLAAHQARLQEAQAKQQQALAPVVPITQGQACSNCSHRTLLNGEEFKCEARGSSHGVDENLGPECRLFKAQLIEGAIASTPVTTLNSPLSFLEVADPILQELDFYHFEDGASYSPDENDDLEEYRGWQICLYSMNGVIGTDIYKGGEQWNRAAEAKQSRDSFLAFVKQAIDQVEDRLAGPSQAVASPPPAAAAIATPVQVVPPAHPAGVLASSAKNSDDPTKNERYSPEYIWKPALVVVGQEIFSLDPATNCKHNPVVPCKTAYTLLDSGMQYDWIAESIWSNFPYSNIGMFIKKYLYHWEKGHFTHGFTLTKNDCATRWYQALAKSATAMCLIGHRITHGSPDEDMNTSFFASCLFYHGPNLQLFYEQYEPLGTVVIRAQELLLKSAN